jgi:hypothetical protein
LTILPGTGTEAGTRTTAPLRHRGSFQCRSHTGAC